MWSFGHKKRRSVVTGEFFHEGIGAVVHVTVRANARQFSARWRGGKIYCSVPAGVGPDELMQALEAMRPRLVARRPSLTYKRGQVLQMPDYRIAIRDSGRNDARIHATMGSAEATVAVGATVNLDEESAVLAVSRMLCRIAGQVAPALLLPQAQAVAARLGVAPRSWSVSSGHRILGRCSAKGEIALSSVLLFVPVELREYVICHELAHLAEMNHSPRFHALCDRYCGGRERELKRRLDSFEWPIVR